MPVGDLGQHAAARGALQEALLQQIGLDDLFEDVALIAERRRHRLDADRAAAVMLGDRAQIAAVQRIEAAMIDFEALQRLFRGRSLEIRSTANPWSMADSVKYAS